MKVNTKKKEVSTRSIKRSKIIPKYTELLGRKIRVYIDSDHIRNREGYYGLANKISCDIHISTMIDDVPVPMEEQEITYFHEIFHLILAKQGYEELLEKANIDLEKIVEDLAVGIHQIITKAKG